MINLNKGISTPIALTIIIVLSVVLVGGVFAYQYYYVAPEEETKIPEIKAPETETPGTENKKAELISFEIVPSEKSEQGITYQSGAEAVLKANNLSKVEFRQRGGGTGIYTSPEGGLVGTGVKIVNANEELWKFVLPSDKWFVVLCALGFNSNNNKVGEICLNNVAGTSNQTADWKIYKNEQYKFEIKYPQNWNLWVTQPDEFSVKGDWGEQIDDLAIFQSRTIGSPYCEFHLTIYSNPKNLSIGDFWRKRLSEVYKFKSFSNITFGDNKTSGVRFLMERTDQPLPNELMAVVAKKNNNIIELFWWGQNPSTSNPDCSKVNQMLSTFKFID